MNRKLIAGLFLTLLYVVPLYGQTAPQKRVAILDVIDRENAVTKGVKMMISGKLSFAITNIPGYEGYDRVDIVSIMDEHEFQRTGLVSDSQIKRLGEMTGADYILVTEVARLDERQIIVTAKILDVETAQVDNDAYVRTEIDVDMMEKKCGELAQTLFRWTPPAEEAETNIPFVVVEQMPLFRGGSALTFRNWVQGQLKYPAVAVKNGIQGKVVVRFVIDRDGSLTDIEVLSTPDQSLSEEVIRVLLQSPRWKSGRQGDTPVRVCYTLQFNFNIVN